MDLKKIGQFLKYLRKEKGIRQEQFAEILGVSGRTVSRWETGSNMPDLDVLIQIADYYEVEIREILDGERKGEKMNKEMEDTVLKVADYSNHEKQRLAKRMSILFCCGFIAFTVYLAMEFLGVADVKGVQEDAASAALAYEDMIVHTNHTDEIVGHLDKSHITVHTYPEYHPETNIATFRVDIDVATCGEITPLSTLDYLIGSFDSDIITMDYRVRGFTRNVEGRKLFIDHKITSIQDYIDRAILDKYDAVDINMYQANIFHTKMLIKEMDLQNYLFNSDIYEITPKTRLQISNSLRQEMIEIFSGMNIY